MPNNNDGIEWDDTPNLGDVSWDEGIQWDDDQPSMLSRFASNVGGTVAGAADIVSGALTGIPLWMKAQADVALGGDPKQEREEMHQSMQDLSPSRLFPSTRENQSYQMMMKPFELLSQGIDTGVEAVGGGEGAKLAAEGLSMALPIPFLGKAGRGVKRGLEAIDPGLRDTQFQKPADLISEREVPRSTVKDIVWEEVPPNPQLDFNQPINPYDVAGHVSEFEQGRTTQIDPLQPELMGRVEDVNSIPTEIARNMESQQLQDFANRASQGSLFEPQMGMNRAFDQFGANELPSQLTKQEFETTLRNLSEQEGTRFHLPEDIDAAYANYLRDMEGTQGGLFDRPSQQEGFARTAQQETNTRMAETAMQDMLDNHPDLVNTRKAISRIEAALENAQRRGWTKKEAEAQAKLETLNRRLNTRMDNLVANFQPPEMGTQNPKFSPAELSGTTSLRVQPEPSGSTGSPPVPRTPVQGSFLPQDVPQQFRAATEAIPGFEKIVQTVPENVDRPPVNNTQTPLEKATSPIPGLGKEAQRHIYENQTPEQIIDAARGEPDGTGNQAIKSTYSGASIAALRRKSSLIKGIYTLMNRAENLSKLAISKQIVPIERSIVALNKNERTLLANTLKDEMFNMERKTPEQINEIFKNNPKVIEAYNKLRQGLLESGEAVNRGRVAAGLEPISLKEYYVSSRWRGNFKSAAYVDGKIVGYLREGSSRGLKASKAAMEKQIGGIEWRDASPKDFRAPPDTLQAGYVDALRILDPDDPIVKAFADAYENSIAAEGATAFNMPFHAEAKGNVRGFIGDKPQFSEAKNAGMLLNSQMAYMKNSYKWAEQQMAIAEAKKVLADPELQATQPNNIEYSKSYIKNALGFGTQTDIRNLESAISRGFGFDRDQVMAGLNMSRAYFYTKQLGLLNPKAFFVQVTQPMFSIPAHIDLVKQGFKYDPITNYTRQMKDFTNMWGDQKGMTEVGRNAINYAKEMGILSINVLDEIRDINTPNMLRKIEKLANINQVKAEEFGRAFTYLGAVHHLAQSGLKGEQLYMSAEAFTNRVMVDYRKFEQPMWMEQGGLVGRSVGTLKNFTNNQYNQLAYYLGQAKKGNVSPLGAILAVQFLMAGVQGMIGVETLTTVWDELIKPALGPKYADKSMKAWMLENMDDVMAYGGLSKLTGINMFGSLSQGNLAGFDTPGSFVAPFATDIAKSATAIGKAVLNPTSGDKWSQALYENLPPHGKGFMENLNPRFTTEQGLSLNPRDLNKGSYRRDSFERAVRYLGATGLKEMGTKERAFEASKRERDINEAKGILRDNYIEAYKTNDKEKQQTVVDTLSKWMGPQELANYLITGVSENIKSRAQDVNQRLLPKSLESVGSMKKYQRIQGLTQ